MMSDDIVAVARAASQHRADVGGRSEEEHVVVYPCLGNEDGYHRWMREDMGSSSMTAACHFCSVGHPRPSALPQERGLGLGVA